MTDKSRYGFEAGICPDCGKKRFTTRKAAKKHHKSILPNEHLSVYQCGDYFHYGHMSYRMKRGLVPRS